MIQTRIVFDCHATDLLYTHLTKKRESNGKERNQSSQIQY